MREGAIQSSTSSKGSRSQPPQADLGLSRASHPLEVATVWARALGRQDLDTALSLYAADSVLHADAGDFGDRTHQRAFLEKSGLLGLPESPDVRGEDGLAVVDFRHVGADRGPLSVRCRIDRGRIAEQWFAHPEPAEEQVYLAPGEVPLTFMTRGKISEGDVDYALDRLQSMIAHISAPVFRARVKVSLAAAPAQERPARAQATLDVDGEPVRCHVAARKVREAIDLLEARVHDQLGHRASRRQALHRSTGISEPSQWRRGSLPSHRPPFFDRPAEERQLVRHKTFAVGELTADEAAFDMEQMDFDFYLFRDLASGEDAVLERRPGEPFRLMRLHPSDTGPGGAAVDVVVDERPAATLSVSEAIDRLRTSNEPFVFFANATTGRGNVVYVRYDGHYGLITPE